MMAEAFHEGEQTLQTQVGARERMSEVGGQVLRSFMPEQHRDFFPLLPFLIVGSLDADHQPWASLLAGPPGFADSPDPRHLAVRAIPQADSPLAAALKAGATLGLLGIQPHTRRRNRMNGVVTVVGKAGFEVEVRQSFGNCPKYIQAREAHYVGPDAPGAVERGTELTNEDMALIRRADTFFIASAHPRAADPANRAHGVDVSHRGGKPGFVRVEGKTLTVPDFLGNRFFNTLGNLAINPRAGLLFPDFESGDLLHLAVESRIILDGPEIDDYAGAERLVRFEVRKRVRLPRAMPLAWGPAQISPHLAATGDWTVAS